MLNLQSKLKIYIDKYRNDVLNAIKKMQFSTDEETITHTSLLVQAGQGEPSARKYVIDRIKNIILENEAAKRSINGDEEDFDGIIINSSDLENIRKIVIYEYDMLINKRYPTYSENANIIDYYQLIDKYKKDEYVDKLKRLDLSKVTGIEEFAEALFARTYGNYLLEPLMLLQINNIEVHGTRKIRIETNTGLWKTIHDYRFNTDTEIETVADHIITQADKGQITKQRCLMESTMLDESRVTIALKPAATEHNIFIKKFDGFILKSIDQLVEIGEITPELLEELKVYAKGRANICIIGGVNSGKTTFAKAYVSLIPEEYKIGMIESDFETQLIKLYPDKDIISLRETEKYSLNDLFIRMLRMNRHILALGEARSYEVEQLIKGMVRGNDGSFSTAHSRTSHDLINNLTWMSIENGVSVDIRVLRYRIASAIDIVLRLWHDPVTGKRYVDQVDEIVTVHNNLDMPYEVNPIYRFNLDNEKVEKVGNVSKEIRDKFRYYGCSIKQIESIVNPEFEKKVG